jgi:FkbM family methyltransferase
MNAASTIFRAVAHPLRSLRAALRLAQDYLFTHCAIPVARREVVSKAFLTRWLPKRPVAVDCGACDGADSLELARILNATVHAFEPVPDLYARLAAKAAADPRVRAHNLALGDVSGTARFHVSGGASAASSSLLAPKEHLTVHPTVTFDSTLEVQTRTLQDWARDHGVPRVDLLWLDVQGYEQRLLEGAGALLDTVSVIHTEVNVSETYESAVLYGDLRRWLEQRGFRVVLERIPEGWAQGNVVFVRRSS